MEKTAGRKKTASVKQAAPEKRASLKKPGLQKKEGAKKKAKTKPAARTAPVVKKTKTAAKVPAKSTEKVKKTSRTKRAEKELSKTARKSSSATAKTTRRPAARKIAPTKAAAKTAPKKPLKKTAGSASVAAKRPRKKTVAAVAGENAARAGTAKIQQVVVRKELPREYGENEVILMPVDPNVIFVDWEIRKEEIPAEDTPITMRVFSFSAGRPASEFHDERFFELRLDGRTGSGFFDIGMPGREVAIEIGLHYNGTFMPILKSPPVSMPEIIVFDELGIAQKLFESGVPVGY